MRPTASPCGSGAKSSVGCRSPGSQRTRERALVGRRGGNPPGVCRVPDPPSPHAHLPAAPTSSGDPGPSGADTNHLPANSGAGVIDVATEPVA